MSSAGRLPGSPPLHSSLGNAHRGSSEEPAEMATAGITDGSLGALNPQEELRLGGTPGIPRASAAGEHRSSREPNGPQAASNPTARGRPSYSRSRESPPNPHPTLTAPASPNSTPTPLLAPTRSAGGLPKKGVGRRNPRLEGRFGDSDCSPQLERRGTQENSQMTTHLSCGPVFGSGSSDVPIAATWSLRLPRPIPPASAEQRLLTAHARAAAGGRGRRRRVAHASRTFTEGLNRR